MLNKIDLSRTDLNLLVLFRAVLEEGHVARAASRLNLTPSAVSHALGRMRRLLNDPLFLRTPTGVVPTARAKELAAPIAEILSRVEGVMQAAVPFDPATSSRRFVIGAPDAILASTMAPLLKYLETSAPRIDVGLVHLMPTRYPGRAQQPWQEGLDKLERREIDLAMMPLKNLPQRFEARRLYDEDFVVAMRKGHVFARAPSRAAFSASPHLMVSLDGDQYGFVDELMAKFGIERRVVLTVPTFMMALAHLSDCNLIAALPRRLVQLHAARFGLAYAELPFGRKPDPIRAIATKAAMKDAGIAWLMETTVAVVEPNRLPKRPA
jgi:DNA-binding transcriptional LysR family regulator